MEVDKTRLRRLQCRRRIELAYRQRRTLSPAARVLAEVTRAVCQTLGRARLRSGLSPPTIAD